MSRLDHDRETSTPSDVAVLPAIDPPSATDEVNHRVANSLQLLSAMVTMEAGRTADPQGRAALVVASQRIGAIASVHRHLYRHHESDTLDLARFVEELGADLEHSCGDGAVGRRIVVVVQDVGLVATSDATNVGIILSELVTNACKHAYAADEPGDVLVYLGATAGGGYLLTVQDHGRGLNATSASTGTGLGSRLVANLAKRLGGSMSVEQSHPGTRFILLVGSS